MNEQILNELTAIFRDILDNDELVATPQLTAEDVEEWDSLSHIQLVVAIEKHWNIKFSSREIMKWQNVGEMADAIAAKVG
ncbi:MAG: acyl carrier protein [Muribaculaceae bacterium]|nr:acyl carrier protein [Muribaculaceae bacterium]MBR1474443.1 acyl carrier protein [Muribaculaceae bacterium]MBR1727137.1 acyl carrier protein [Muribaculaceae bacterium]